MHPAEILKGKLRCEDSSELSVSMLLPYSPKEQRFFDVQIRREFAGPKGHLDTTQVYSWHRDEVSK